jgi:hypothetical protein
VTLLLGMGVLTAVAMVLIWAPAYPERHEWMQAMDALGDRRCANCGRPFVWGRACRIGGECEPERGEP